MAKPAYTKRDLDKFSRLYDLTGSHGQMDRIKGRLGTQTMIRDLGEDAVRTMTEKVKAREAKSKKSNAA